MLTIYLYNMTDFDKQFLDTFQLLGQQAQQKYEKVLQNYRNFIIPFEVKRMKENQSMSFKNTSLERDKLDLLKKMEELTSQNHRNEYIMEKQAKKLIDLQQTVHALDKANSQSLGMIQALKMLNSQLQSSLNQKIQIVKQVQEDKKQVLKDFDQKNNQYNALLSNYMRDKNSIAQKLNYMNDLQQSLIDKQKRTKEQQFYLKKQWEEFEQAKKSAKEAAKQQKPLPPPPNRIFKKPSSQSRIDDEQKQQKQEKKKFQRDQILRNPVKKIIKHHNNQIYDLAFNFNGSLIATCGGDRTIKVYDVNNFRNGATIQSQHDSIYLSLNLDYTGEKLLAGSTNCQVQVFASSSGKLLHNFVGHGYKVNSVSWSSSKQKCVSGSEDKQIKIWDVDKATNVLSIACGKAVKYVSCNSVEPVIYSGHSDGSVRIYSLNQSSSPIAQIKGLIDYPINSVAVLSNRNQLLVSSQEGSPVHLFDLKMNKSVAKYQGKQFFNTLARAEVSPTQKYVVAGNCDGYIYYWLKDKQTMEKRISGHDSAVTSLKYHFLSNIMVSCDKEGNVIVWQ